MIAEVPEVFPLQSPTESSSDKLSVVSKQTVTESPGSSETGMVSIVGIESIGKLST